MTNKVNIKYDAYPKVMPRVPITSMWTVTNGATPATKWGRFRDKIRVWRTGYKPRGYVFKNDAELRIFIYKG